MPEVRIVDDKIGNIYQIDPDKDSRLGGQYVVATEIKEWGIQGYLLLDRPDDGTLVRYKGKAFIRKKFEELHYIGVTEWMSVDKEEDDE